MEVQKDADAARSVTGKEGRVFLPCRTRGFWNTDYLDDGTVLGSVIGGQVLPEHPDDDAFGRLRESLVSMQRPMFGHCTR